MTQAPLTVRRWTRKEYDRLVELGVFAREPLELIGGQLIVAEPQGSYHAGSVDVAGAVLRAALPPGWIARTQLLMGWPRGWAAGFRPCPGRRYCRYFRRYDGLHPIRL